VTDHLRNAIMHLTYVIEELAHSKLDDDGETRRQLIIIRNTLDRRWHNLHTRVW
jgi:hypothetical protein